MASSDPSRPLVIGLDVGTNATKCLVCDAGGRVVAQSRRNYALSHPKEGWAEQDAEGLWRAVVEALSQAAAEAASAGTVIALSLSSQGGTTIVTDDRGDPIRPAISWLDMRAGEQGRRLAAELGQEWLHRASGWEAASYMPVVHVPWLREREPETYARAVAYRFVNDFVIARLTGRRVMDPSDAALTMLYNVEQGDWDDTILRAAGVRREQLSPIADSGTVVGPLRPEVAAQVGLPPETIIVNGGHDQYCAALGAGVVAPGDVLLSCGTAWVLLAVTPGLVRDPMRTFAHGRHVLPGRWGVLCSMPAAGAGFDWLARHLVAGPDETRPRYDVLDSRLIDPEPGSHGLLCLPFLAGIEVATRGTGLWGTLTGLTLAHTRWDIAQSFMEGVALELRWVLERLEGLDSPPRLLHMVGGATRSPAWPRIVADATGVPVAVTELPEAAARGAAMLAALGAGLHHDIEAMVGAWRTGERPVEARPARTRVYDGIYARFRALDRALRQGLKGTPGAGEA